MARRAPSRGKLKPKNAKPGAAPERSLARFPIVGIGASAGGVEALETFFRAIPEDCQLGFVVIMHLAPGIPSQLVEVLSRCTAMPVVQAADGMPVQRCHAYVLPPNSLLTIRHGRLRLTPSPEPHWKSRPIDSFFASLAEDQEDFAIGVLLSGAGSDGAAGFAGIQRHGGVTIVQARDEAGPKFDEMPRSAQEIGVVDLAVRVSRIPAALVRLAGEMAKAPPELPTAGLNTIFRVLRQRTGHDFSHYKHPSFLRRLKRRMQVHNDQTLQKYVQRLRRDPQEAIALFRDVLIGVTEFFRDAEAFEALRERVIPRLFDGKGERDEVRVWVAACASGEEAFSIAMLLREYMDSLATVPRVQIFATDIEEHTLAIARAAKFPAATVSHLGARRIKRFFVVDQGKYRVARELRDMCVFSTHSAIKDPPFSRLDLVSCRNLLIYFAPDLQAELMRIFHYALKPGGFLFIGASENISRHEELFTAVDARHRIFQRHDVVISPPRTMSLGRSVPHASANDEAILTPRTRLGQDRIARSAAATVMEQFGPPYVVVDETGGIIEFSSRTGPYLEAPAGPPNRKLFAMARRELKASLRALLRKAKETHRTCRSDPIAIHVEGAKITIRVAVEPLHQNSRTHYLVVFQNAGNTPDQTEQKPTPARGGDAGETERQQLEFELKETREQLQAMVEELETANEELLSSNEELQSANEELQTSKEELQSVNEELETVNLELNSKVQQLDQAHSDLKNIFDGTQIATIFIDRNLIIRNYTPAVSAIFNLLPSDQGRPLTDISHRLKYDTLGEDIRNVLAKNTLVERRATTVDGTAHYLMRILPYRAAGKRVDGAVLTLIDISNLVKAEEHQKLLTAELSHRVKNTLAVVTAMAGQTLKHSSTLDEFSQAFQRRLLALGVTNDILSKGDWSRASLAGVMQAVLMPHSGAADHRVALKGPEIILTSRAAVTLGMAIDELATNASKYGALSNSRGRISIEWKLKGRPGAESLELHWHERGGPVVKDQRPAAGLGTELLTRSINYEMRGSVKLKYAKTGVECAITIPANPKLFTIVAANGNARTEHTRKSATKPAGKQTRS